MRHLAIVCLLSAAAGCGSRSLLQMKPLPPSYAWQTAPGAAAGSGAGAVPGASARASAVSGAASDEASAPVTRPGALGAVWSGLPAPHRAPRSKQPAPTPTSIAEARALIGVRDPRSSAAFALAVAAGVAHPRALPDVADGPALVTWARTHDALAPFLPGAAAPPAIEPGDLLVFDRAAGGRPASLVAVALARDSRGVVEMLYLAGGVIRRGHLDPTRPRTARDRDRRVVNTYLRHGADQPPKGTRYLAGELLGARIRLR